MVTILVGTAAWFLVGQSEYAETLKLVLYAVSLGITSNYIEPIKRFR